MNPRKRSTETPRTGPWVDAGTAVPQRRAELAANLALVEQRVVAACAAARRPRAEVTLIAVTKTWPPSDVRLLAELGVRDIGENRDQEAAPKARACAGLGIRWHFVGQLQANKARSVVEYAGVVHSVDRLRLVEVLDREARRVGRRVTCLVQVSLEPGGRVLPGRGGVPPGQVPALADEVAAAPALDLGGVMAVAPLGGDPVEAFTGLTGVAARVRADHPAAQWISAGMSADLEQAVVAGATHVRVGAALLGMRPPLG